MLKFLRQYNKYILVVGGVLLMIAFLIPGAINQFGRNQGNTTVLRIGGQRISMKRMSEATHEYYALGHLVGRALPLFGVAEGPEQWLLLTELAERGGFVGGPQEGRTYLPVLARQVVRIQYGQYADQLFNNPQFAPTVQAEIERTTDGMIARFPGITHETGLNDEQIETAVAKLRGVNRLQNAYALSARVSTPRSMVQAKKQLDRATIDYIFLSPERVLPDIPEPDEAALQAHLDRFKGSKPGDGELGIGYLLPQRVKLEYMTVSRSDIESKIHPDPKDVRKRFQSTSVPKDSKFEDMRQQIETDLKNEAVEKVLREIDVALRTEVGLKTRKLAADGQFKVLPADWATTRPGMESLRDLVVQHVQQKTGITIDAPAVAILSASFLTEDDLAALPGIGSAFLKRGSRPEPFAPYALAVRELKPNTPYALQVGLPAPEPVKDQAGNVYYFTVLDARKESAPLSVDDAREMLVRDWKRLQAFEILKRDMEGFKQKAIAEGLDALDPAYKPATPDAPAPLSSPLVKRGSNVTRSAVTPRNEEVDNQEFRDLVVEAASRLDPTVEPATLPMADRTLVVASPKKQGLVAVQIKLYTPLTVEVFRAQQGRIANQLQFDEVRTLEHNPFTLVRLRERLKVTDREGKKLADRSRNNQD